MDYEIGLEIDANKAEAGKSGISENRNNVLLLKIGAK